MRVNSAFTVALGACCLFMLGCMPKPHLENSPIVEKPSDDCPVAGPMWTSVKTGFDQEATNAFLAKLETAVKSDSVRLSKDQTTPAAGFSLELRRLLKETSSKEFKISEDATTLFVAVRDLECAILRGTFSGDNRLQAERELLKLLTSVRAEKKTSE